MIDYTLFGTNLEFTRIYYFQRLIRMIPQITNGQNDNNCQHIGQFAKLPDNRVVRHYAHFIRTNTIYGIAGKFCQFVDRTSLWRKRFCRLCSMEFRIAGFCRL